MAKIRKALMAAAGAAVAALVTAAMARGGMPTAAEIGAALGLGVAAGWAAWRVPNAPAQ